VVRGIHNQEQSRLLRSTGAKSNWLLTVKKVKQLQQLKGKGQLGKRDEKRDSGSLKHHLEVLSFWRKVAALQH